MGKGFFYCITRKELPHYIYGGILPNITGGLDMEEKNNVRRSLIAFGVLIVLAIVMLIAYFQLRPTGSTGKKEIEVEVIIPEKENEEFTLHTNAEFLRQALEEAELVKGIESEYGLFITEVNGRVADDTKQEWWCITKNKENVNYGVDEIAINDGDHYEITLTVGY